MAKIAMRQTCNEKPSARPHLGFRRSVLACAMMAASVMTIAMMAKTLGGAAAANEAKVDTTTISLAGRWSGPYYGYGRVGEKKTCDGKACDIVYDIVACKEGWCGISVGQDKSCGPVGLRLAAEDNKQNGEMAFKGKLELTKGAAGYTVEAWYRLNEGKQSLHFLGDTGSELVLMRRSFPFEADLTRTGDAVCKLDKATS